MSAITPCPACGEQTDAARRFCGSCGSPLQRACAACSFINVLLEMGSEHPAGGASVEYLDHIRAVVRRFADEAGLHDTESFARSWHIPMKGSIVSAAEGDVEAAWRGKAMARLLIDHYP